MQLWSIKYFLTQIWISSTDYEEYVFYTFYMFLVIIFSEAVLGKLLH